MGGKPGAAGRQRERGARVGSAGRQRWQAAAASCGGGVPGAALEGSRAVLEYFTREECACYGSTGPTAERVALNGSEPWEWRGELEAPRERDSKRDRACKCAPCAKTSSQCVRCYQNTSLLPPRPRHRQQTDTVPWTWSYVAWHRNARRQSSTHLWAGGVTVRRVEFGRCEEVMQYKREQSGREQSPAEVLCGR